MTIQNKDYQNLRKTHIFFGVEDERGTHSKPLKTNRKASERLGISLELPAQTQTRIKLLQAV